MVLAVLINFLSLFLYIFAPSDYSLSFCILQCAIFLISGVNSYLVDKNRDFPSFHLIFSISFFCVTYLYPLFVYNISSSFSLFAIASYSDSIISKATALATFAYSCYCTGYVHQLKRNRIKPQIQKSYVWSSRKIESVNKITIFIFILFVLFGGLDFYTAMYNKDAAEVGGISKYLVMILQSFIIVLAMLYIHSNTNKVRIKILVTLVAISCIIILTGSRTLPLFTLLLVGYVVCYVYKIKKLYIFLAIILGVVGMSMIGFVRTGDVASGLASYSYETSEIGRLDMFTDLIVCNRNLYAAYDIVDKTSCTYGLTFIGPLFSPIPFLQSIFLKIVNVPGDYLYSAAFITRYDLGADRSVGLGTHTVADVYLTFGFIGIILFYYLGRLIVYARTKMRGGDPVAAIIYLTLFADAVYLTRASLLNDLRNICWALLIYYFFLKSVRKSVI